MNGSMKGQFVVHRNIGADFSYAMLQCGKIFNSGTFLQTVDARPSPHF
jgi:hypothetical protein